jgi:putative hemolysin
MIEMYLEIAAIVLLILLNGVFSMSEMAVVASRKLRLQARIEGGSRGAKAALELAEAPERFFSTVQIGITLIGVLTGAFGGATIAEKLAAYFKGIAWLAPYSAALGLALVVAPIALLTLVLGELAPKRLALRYPERLACATAPLMRGLMRLSHPAVLFLSYATGFVLKLLGVSSSTEPTVTEEEIRGLIGEGARTGVLEHAERDMLERIIRLGDRQLSAMMTHRSKVVWLDLDDPREENMRKLVESPFSRFPVGQGSLANLNGVLKAKHALAACRKNPDARIEEFAQQPLYAPETMRALRLLELFKQQQSMHFAIVVDEYGDVQGIVTLNDILEAIVGDVPSLGEESEPQAVRREDGSWLLDALMPMDEVCALLKIRGEEEEVASQTLAGFLLRELGEMPTLGCRVDALGHRFEVVDMDGKRIDSVLATRTAPSEEA